MTTGYLGPTVIKQYSNSVTLLQLLDSFDQWVDLTQFSADFLYNVWDISTAVGFGLDIWGRILGRSRYLEIEAQPGENFGFDIGATPGTNWWPWSTKPFYGGQSGGTVSYALDDVYYRKLLLVKAAANIASCDCGSLNSLMRAMFGDRGKCYVGYDISHPMNIGYHFEFVPTPIEKAIIESGLFPQPAGTDASFIYGPPAGFFGFATANVGANPRYVTGWSQGPFYEPFPVPPGAGFGLDYGGSYG